MGAGFPSKSKLILTPLTLDQVFGLVVVAVVSGLVGWVVDKEAEIKYQATTNIYYSYNDVHLNTDEFMQQSNQWYLN